MKNYQFMFAILLFISCKKNDSESDTLKCITGDWVCINGLEIINYDTVEFFQNGFKHIYWYGQRENTYPGTINLSIDNDGQYHFIENIEGFQMDTTMVGNIFNYTLNWELLNTNKSNTHINMKIYFLTDQIYSSVFKIEEISDNKLVIISDEDYYYMKYEFERDDEGCTENKFSQQIDQTPQNIIGNWSLNEYLYSTNDSAIRRYYNDTLYIIQYQPINGHYIRYVYKYKYSLNISIETLGELFLHEEVNANIIDKHYYWFWKDENPHKRIRSRLIYSFPDPGYDYEIVSLTDKELILRNEEYSVESKFIKN